LPVKRGETFLFNDFSQRYIQGRSFFGAFLPPVVQFCGTIFIGDNTHTGNKVQDIITNYTEVTQQFSYFLRMGAAA
jgi:hypothetical protein